MHFITSPLKTEFRMCSKKDALEADHQNVFDGYLMGMTLIFLLRR